MSNEDLEKAFDKLHKLHMESLKKQGELEKENEQLKKENKFLRCTIESNSQDDYIDYLEKQNERLKEDGRCGMSKDVTIGELIDEIKKFPRDTPIWFQLDENGLKLMLDLKMRLYGSIDGGNSYQLHLLFKKSGLNECGDVNE